MVKRSIKRNSRAVALLACIALAIALLPAAAFAEGGTGGGSNTDAPLATTTPDNTTRRASEPCGKNLYWTLDGTALTITGTGKMWDFFETASGFAGPWGTSITSVTIPEGVTSIGECAFMNCANLTSVEIPEGVTSIGDYAFANSGLKSVEIPSSVVTIGENAFRACESLESVTFADGSKCKTIDSYAFIRCTSLTSVTIPTSVTEIAWGAFCNCSSLEIVTIPDSLESIEYEAFAVCGSNNEKLDVFYAGTPEKWESFDATGSYPGYTTVHMRHMVSTVADPADGGTVENTTAAGEGPYWDIDPNTLNPTTITVEATPKVGYVLTKLTGTYKDGDVEKALTLQAVSGKQNEYSFNMPNADVEVTATFEAQKHTVAFNANGHGKAPDAQEVEHGKKAKRPASPTADGYTFGGWYTDKACKETYDFTTPVTADLTLYAKWAKKPSSSTKSTSPKTGDPLAGAFAVAFALAAASALALAVSRRRRRG